MKQLMKVVLILCLVTSCITSLLQAQWRQTSGPAGGRVNCLAVSGANVIAGGEHCNIYCSSNDGANWLITNYTPDYITSDNSVKSLVTFGSDLLAGTMTGIFKSTDHGCTWNSVGGHLLALSFTASGANLFAGGGGGVYLSTTSGTEWTAVNNGLPSQYGQYSDVTSIASTDSKIFAGTRKDGIYRSTNNGATWTAVNTGLVKAYGEYRVVNCFAFNGSNVFAGMDSVYISADNGTTWTAVNSGLPSGAIHCLAVNGPTVFAGSDSGVFRSTNNGTKWTAVNTGLTNKKIHCLTVSGSKLFAGTDSCVFFSIDNGTHWTGIGSGMSGTGVDRLASHGSQLFARTNIGTFVTTNAGSDWTAVNSELTGVSVNCIAGNSSKRFVGTNDGVYLSTDDGLMWTPCTSAWADKTVLSLALIDSNLFAGTNKGLFLSTDNGTVWKEISHGYQYLTNSIPALAVMGSKLIVATTNNGVFCSTDNGGSWRRVDSNMYTWGFQSLAVIDQDVLIGGGDGFYRFIENGTVWEGHHLSNSNSKCLLVSGSNIFAADGTDLNLSTNKGTTWQTVRKGSFQNYVIALAIQGDNLFVGTSRSGVWYRPLSELITSMEEGTRHARPRNISLLQNYPNPFNPSTDIVYRISDFGLASLKIFDVLGNELATLVNTFRAPGEYTVTWHASGEASGIYFYRLDATSSSDPSKHFSQTKKMLLVR